MMQVSLEDLHGPPYAVLAIGLYLVNFPYCDLGVVFSGQAIYIYIYIFLSFVLLFLMICISLH